MSSKSRKKNSVTRRWRHERLANLIKHNYVKYNSTPNWFVCTANLWVLLINWRQEVALWLPPPIRGGKIRFEGGFRCWVDSNRIWLIFNENGLKMGWNWWQRICEHNLHLRIPSPHPSRPDFSKKRASPVRTSVWCSPAGGFFPRKKQVPEVLQPKTVFLAFY